MTRKLRSSSKNKLTNGTNTTDRKSGLEKIYESPLPQRTVLISLPQKKDLRLLGGDLVVDFYFKLYVLNIHYMNKY